MPWGSEIWVSPGRVPWCGVIYVPQVTHVPQVTQHLRRDVGLRTSERSAGIAGGVAVPRPMMGPQEARVGIWDDFPYPAAIRAFLGDANLLSRRPGRSNGAPTCSRDNVCRHGARIVR